MYLILVYLWDYLNFLKHLFKVKVYCINKNGEIYGYKCYCADKTKYASNEYGTKYNRYSER